jgi:hypothetical protein
VADNKPPVEVNEIAGGWITEKKGTEVPAFLKGAYFVIFCGCALYLIVYMFGEVDHSDRGPLVREFNMVSATSPAFMYGVVALAVVFFIGMVIFAFKKPHDE